MKKILLICLAALAVCSTSFAQSSILGTWFCEFTESGSNDEEKAKVSMAFSGTDQFTLSGTTFTRNMTMLMTIDGEGKGEAAGKKLNMTLTVKGSISGTWTYQDGILTLDPGKKAKPVIEVESDGLPGVIKAMLTPMIKKEIKEGLSEIDRSEVISITATELTLKDIPDPKSKDKSEPETTVYKRK